MSSKDELQLMKLDLQKAIKMIQEIHDFLFTNPPGTESLAQKVKKEEKKK